MWSAYIGTLSLAAALAVALPTTEGLQIRRNAPGPYYVDHERMEAVKDVFQRSWDAYYQFAFPHDSLLPVSKSFQDDRNGWGASAIDALDTAIVMENTNVINLILNFVPSINFGAAVGDVSVFETTIRYLGGLLSAYDLLTGPQKKLASNTGAVKTLLEQAVHLAGNLSVAFGTPSGVPDNTLIYDPVPRRNGDGTNALATIGTLVLEWTRLSDLTSDPTWGNLAQRGEDYLLDPKGSSVNVNPQPFPGLLGFNVNVTTGEFVDDSGSWGGGTDSFYEYLIKMYLYDTAKYTKYKDRWVLAADSSIEYLSSHPSTKPELTYLSAWNGKELSTNSQHLACFAGGNFILGGLILDVQKYLDFGLELTASCYALYSSTLTGIGPESFAWQDSRVVGAQNGTNNGSSSCVYEFPNGACIGTAPDPPSDQGNFYDKNGFWITDGVYILRPEVVESIYYAYRATGDRKYQDWAWEALKAINQTCEVWLAASNGTEEFAGYSSVEDVNAAQGGGFLNEMQSFWFAEVLKYMYLIFAEDSEFQVKADHSNEFVFNTESHPVRINGSPI